MSTEQPRSRLRWPLVVLGGLAFLVVGMLVSIQFVGGISHLTGGTTEVDTRVLSVAEGDDRCSGGGADPWEVTYGWTDAGEEFSLVHDVCSDYAPPIGEQKSFWFDDDGHMVTYMSPEVGWAMAIATDVGAFLIVVVAYVFFRRRARRRERWRHFTSKSRGAGRRYT